ncbi:MAG: hypothetical protein ACTSYQ_02235 [Candidatus Odinarchaeia archaeon]
MEERIKQGRIHYSKASVLYAIRKFKEAEEELLKALQYYQNSSKRGKYKKEISAVFKLLGDIYYLKGEEDKAKHIYEISHAEYGE